MTSPAAASRVASAEGDVTHTGAALIVAIIALGAATLPRQLTLLVRALAPEGMPLGDAHHAALKSGLVRLILADRLLPPPTLLLAAAFVILVAEPVLALTEEQRPRIRAVVALGLVPVIVQRIGEAAVTYFVGAPAPPAPGWAVSLPQQFATGPTLFWPMNAAPLWIEAVSARLNLVTLWSVWIWTAGLRTLDDQPFSLWHVTLPAASLAAAGLVTWWLGPLVLSIILGHP